MKELKEKIIEFKKSMLLDKNGIIEFNQIIELIEKLERNCKDGKTT